MRLTQLQKAKLILTMDFVVLFIIILVTPSFITKGVATMSEEVVEGIFLGIELLFVIFVFRHYDAQTKKKEEEATLLNVKLKEKERELLNALEYLGKVNVQVSMIRSIFEAMKVPLTKSQLNRMCSELLRTVNSVTKEKGSLLRIVNLKTGRTVGESAEFASGSRKQRVNIGNGELVERFNKKNKSDKKGISIFFSSAENFYIKTFVFVPHKENKKFSSEEQAFLEVIANQCEILFLLFNSRYYRE